MNRHMEYLHKVSRMLGRKLRPGEFSKIGRAIKLCSNEVLDLSIDKCNHATGVTDLVAYFLYLCFSSSNKKKTNDILKGLENGFKQDI